MQSSILAEPAAPTRSGAAPFEPPKDYVPAAESRHALYQVATERFVGPLDLLLFLIRRHQLDVFDIPMAFVCRRYLAVLHAMQECDLDVAAEFVATAAELLHIKSRMLLPKEAVAVDEEEADPRAALVERLLLLQTFQRAAAALAARPRLGQDTFAPEPPELAQQPRALRAMASFELATSMVAMKRRRSPPHRHQVMVEQVPLRRRMQELLTQLYAGEEPLSFCAVLARVTARIDLVVLFLAVLELAKQHLLAVAQADDGGQFVLRPRLATLAAATERLSGADVEKAFD